GSSSSPETLSGSADGSSSTMYTLLVRSPQCRSKSPALPPDNPDAKRPAQSRGLLKMRRREPARSRQQLLRGPVEEVGDGVPGDARVLAPPGGGTRHRAAQPSSCRYGPVGHRSER